MRKTALLIITAAVIVSVLASCSQKSFNENSDVQSSEIAASATEQTAERGKDMTITVENEFDTDKYAEQMKNAQKVVTEAQHRFAADSVSDFRKNATDIIECEVVKTHFAVFCGDAYTVADVKVIDPILGELNKDDVVSVVTYGGYVSKYDDTLATDPDGAAKLSDKEIEKQKNNIYCKKSNQNEDFIQDNTKYVFVLIKTDSLNPNHDFFSGAYGTMTQDMTIYKDIGNGRYARYPNSYLEKNADKTENSIECFTVDWLKSQLEK